MKSHILVACLTLTTACSLLAAPTKTTLSGIPYVGVQLGYGGAQTPTIDVPGMTTKRYDGAVYGVETGYLFNITSQFKFGPEFGFKGYPKNTYKSPDVGYNGDTLDLSYSGHYFDLLANAQYCINAHWSLMGKLGAAAASQEEMDDLGTSKVSKENNAILPEVVLAAGYNVTPQFGVSLSFDNVFGSTIANNTVGQSTNAHVASITTYMLGVTYSFH